MNLLRWLRKELVQITLLALPFALAAAWWNKIPPVIATHWDFHNRPDGWMSKGPGLLLLPVANVGLCLLIAALPRLDPRLRRQPEANTARQRRLWRMYRCALTGFFSVLALAVIAVAAGWPVNVGRVCGDGAFVLFAVLGNFFGGLEPNYVWGIRTPWTLDDPGTWRATHRLVGRWMVFGALALLVAGCFVGDVTLLALLMGYVVSLAVGGMAYSAWFFQRRRMV